MSRSKPIQPEAHLKTPEEYQDAIKELVNALKLCLECNGRPLSWEAETEANILVSRYGEPE
jgi:hypothetical protein